MPRGGYRPGAGRRKGVKTKVRRELESFQAAQTDPILKTDPIKGMEDIARNPKASLELRGRMFAELAGYVYAKKKAITISTPPGQALALQVTHIQGVDE